MAANTAPNKILEIAVDRGERPEIFIPRLIDEHGSIFQAAAALGVYPNAIYNFLAKHPELEAKYVQQKGKGKNAVSK